jgi:hypothetical protein
VIRTDSKSYGISDIYNVEEAEYVMNKILKDLKSNK